MPVPARAQAYPNRPITLVIPLPPGGTNDIMARAVADKLSTALGQQIVIENRAAGGSGTVGTRQVAKSAPDGYTLLLGYTSTLATGPSMYRNVGYDPRKDFAPIGLIAIGAGLAAGASERAGPQRGRPDRDDEGRKPGVPGRHPRHRHRQLPGLGAVRPAGGRRRAADSLQGLQSVDHRSRRRPRQGRLQSDPGVARRARRRLDPGAGRDLAETLHRCFRTCRPSPNRGCPASTRC